MRCPDGCATCDSVDICTACTDFNKIILNGRCASPCGNANLNFGEQCDDGNTLNGDGCSGVCMVENGWRCSGVPSVCEMIQQIRCGDGKMEGSE